MGIPMVRGLGSGVSHDPILAARPGLCERATPAFPARMVHASERANSRVRMEFFRRESAGPRVGLLAHLQNQCAGWKTRHAFPRALFSKTAAQLYVVGESQGYQGQTPLRRRLSRAR